MAEENGRIQIIANRLGNPTEIAKYLLDVNAAYNGLYSLNAALDSVERWERYGPFPFHHFPGFLALREFSLSEPAPQNQIVLTKVQISSPGLWEFLGAAISIQQLVSFLKWRDERKKNKEWRDADERTQRGLEIEQLKRTALRQDLEIVREFRELGVNVDDMLWQLAGKYLHELAKHQDSGLIGGAE